MAQFVKRFFEKNLPNCAINFTFTQERDYKLVRKADNLGAGVAKSLSDAILIRAISLCYGDFAALYGNGIAATAGLNSEFLLLFQIQNTNNSTLADNLRAGCGSVIGRHQNQRQTQRKNDADQGDPVFVFHENHPTKKLLSFCPFFS